MSINFSQIKKIISEIKSIEIRAGILLLIILTLAQYSKADNYFWVSGSGDWSDINHWATTSGGSVLHAQVPTAYDDVFFDVNSFAQTDQSITINLKNAVCQNMNWTGVNYQPALVGSDTTNIRIYGSLKFDAGMQQNYQGQFMFEATGSGKTIETDGQIFNNNVIFEGDGGGWQLVDDFNCVATVSFTHGSLQTNGNSLICESFFSTSQFQRTLLLGNSLIDVGMWKIDGTNLIFDALSANFQIGNTLENSNGNPLYYPDIHFTGDAGVIVNTNVYVHYHDLFFDSSGTISGDCTIHDVDIKITGSISGSDTIHNISIHQDGSVAGGHHVINELHFYKTGSLTGFNKVKKVISGDAILIKESNEIDSAFCHTEAVISGQNSIQFLSVSRRGSVLSQNNIHRADLYGDTYFSGENSFDILNLNPGRTYTFHIGSVQTVHNELNITGNCNAPIRMLSDTNGVQSTIRKVNGTVSGDYLSLRDIKAEGVTPFQALRSVDLGNNTNWDIDTSDGVDLYWVNGAGSWSDENHWDLNSGGAGGHCPPTEIDNAFFDSNSFGGSGQSVNIDIENAVCRDMTWDDGIPSPVFSGPDTNNIRIFGSLTLSTAMQWLFRGQIFFEAVELGKTITMAGNRFISSCWFNGRGGSWKLIDSFESTRYIYFQQGEIFTLANPVTCYAFSSTDTTTRTLHLSTTTVTMTGVGLNAWSLNGQNLNLFADSSLLITTGVSANIVTFNGTVPLVYNNVIFQNAFSSLKNISAYCVYNVVSNYGLSGLIEGNCTIDSALFYDKEGKITDSDTIRAVIYYDKNGRLMGGNHVVKIAIFHDDGFISGNNIVDTALFYRNATISDSNNIDTCIVYNRMSIKGINNIRTFTLLGDGIFQGENTFYDLRITKSKSYYFEHDKTQTIIDNLFADGSCTGPIFMQSDQNGMQATIEKVNGNLAGQYLTLRDMRADGVIPFTAYNSVDLGNNSGWNIYISDPKELYWVNGQGKWSDSLHWAGMSGGFGGDCIPTPIDNVYFDENSFLNHNDTVEIDIGNATCHNMDWTGSKLLPVFHDPDTNFLRIYGNLTFAPQMLLQINGPVFFESTHEGNHLLLNGNTFPSDIYFEGVGGEWILDDNFATMRNIYFSEGKLRLNEHNMSAYSFNSNFETKRTLTIDNASFSLNGNGVEAWFINGTQLNMTSTASTITLSGNNSLFRTDKGGPFAYHNVNFESISRIYNNNTQVSFDNIHFLYDGQIHGDCTIDTVISEGSVAIFDSDNITYVMVKGATGLLQGGNHNVQKIFFNGTGNIIGTNIIDSVQIGGRGVLSGNNQITGSIVFGGVANIEGQNNINYAYLHNDGSFNGTNHFGGLKFSPGNIYEMEEGLTQTIQKEFIIRGNNCFPITLRSQKEGQQAFVSMPVGNTVSGDFIELRDMAAIGGADFYAGHFSTDISNNTGWIFDNAPGYIYGFDNDTTACSGSPLIISTDNFNPDDKTTFLWQDGSTSSTFQVSGESSVWVHVTYGNNCTYTDTIHINYSPSPQVDLGDDRTLCSGDSLSIPFNSDSVSYVWSDGTTDSVYLVHNSGICSVTVTNDRGCSASDSIYVTALPAPFVNLGSDTTIYSSDFINLDAENQGAAYVWSTGDTTRSITVNGEGDFWVAVLQDGCRGYDTISVSVYPDCILAIPNAFSPNGDGHNDILYIRGEGFTDVELMIFNRIGEMVFETKDNSIGWDGAFRGKQQPVDVYMYSLKGMCVSGQAIVKKGNITLLR